MNGKKDIESMEPKAPISDECAEEKPESADSVNSQVDPADFQQKMSEKFCNLSNEVMLAQQSNTEKMAKMTNSLCDLTQVLIELKKDSNKKKDEPISRTQEGPIASGSKTKAFSGSGAGPKVGLGSKKAERKLWIRKENESRIECIMRHLEEAGNNPRMIREAISELQLRTSQDMEKIKAKPARIIVEENPLIPFLTCCFYQIGDCHQKVYSGVHLDRNVDVTKKAYLHACPICLRLLKGKDIY